MKLPTEYIEQEEAKKVYEAQHIPISTLADRVRHVVQCVFNGRRIVIFSGGTFATEDALLEEARAIEAGGGFGSIMGGTRPTRALGRAEPSSAASWTSTQENSRKRGASSLPGSAVFRGILCLT